MTPSRDISSGILDLTKEIKEGILEHKTKLESRLEKKEEAKVCLTRIDPN